jgi:hypothetical protein
LNAMVVRSIWTDVVKQELSLKLFFRFVMSEQCAALHFAGS